MTNEGLFQFRVIPFGLCNAPAAFERLMDRVLCGMCWLRCLVYLDDVISFGGTIPEALARLEEVLSRLSNFELQLKAKKCTFMQMEVVFLGHIVGRTGLAGVTLPNCRRSGTGMHRIKLKGCASWLAWLDIAGYFCEGLCGPSGTIGSVDSEGRPLCLDGPSTEGV